MVNPSEPVASVAEEVSQAKPTQSAPLFCGPVWALLVYGYVSMRIRVDPRQAPSPGSLEILSSVIYIIAIIAACPMLVMFSLNEYSSLPVQPVQQCYVVTAAARGHRRFVGSWIQNADGDTRLVNRQLNRLRAFERLLAARMPREHRLLRYHYDRIGPSLAARISNPWFADLAYLSLKPAEWIAKITLRCCVERSH